MFIVGKALVSEDVLEKQFVCDLHSCKGACCVEGDAGAPLEEEEVKILEQEFENIKPFLREEGIESIKAQGTSVVDSFDGEPVTPLVNEKECAYAVFDKKGHALCGIEKAHKAGRPLSKNQFLVTYILYGFKSKSATKP